MILKDQRGMRVNTDNLVLLPNNVPSGLEDTIIRAEWHEVNGIIMASILEIGGYKHNSIIPTIEFTKETEILYIHDQIKRYNEKDGFYHA